MRCAPQDSRASLGWVPLRRPAPRFARATNTCALSGLTPIVLSWSRPTVMIAATCGGRLRHRKVRQHAMKNTPRTLRSSGNMSRQVTPPPARVSSFRVP
ncbi:hypothetical protein PF002_g10403 [Phytophthora fragariae]|uniref:Uncharacterized protein n=1 Tax=Phytophthora fragariae TaxID=53985 RepID=A0A6A3ZM09_9STRA|nr:hypothetical protein PF002_g10403 [Phytophthora fragariae]